MKDVTARVVIEERLASVPAVRDILNDPPMHFSSSVRPRGYLMADDADIVLAAVGDGDDASVEELLSARPSPSRPRVMLVTSATSRVFHEEAIIRGALEHTDVIRFRSVRAEGARLRGARRTVGLDHHNRPRVRPP